MNITLTSTTKLVELETPTGKVPARVWEGRTDSGIPVHAFVTRIAPTVDHPSSEITKQFEDELQACAAPTPAIRAYPFRMFLP